MISLVHCESLEEHMHTYLYSLGNNSYIPSTLLPSSIDSVVPLWKYLRHKRKLYYYDTDMSICTCIFPAYACVSVIPLVILSHEVRAFIAEDFPCTLRVSERIRAEM